MKFNYDWKLSDGYPAPGVKKHGSKVFSCFACGGGSTMGYKLAGYDVIGCNEIDPKVMEAYKVNHKPTYSFLEPIQEFKDREDLPKELYELDILDGSPPCSSFSTSGLREKAWGKEKKFREGQEKQVLDTLFFDFIDLAKRLQPKIVVAENVQGMLVGAARKYLREIYIEFEKAGYNVQHYLLNAKRMGVPQDRRRLFIIAMRNDISNEFLESVSLFDKKPKIDLDFNLKRIPYKQVKDNSINDYPYSEYDENIWQNRIDSDTDYSDVLKRIENRNSNWSAKFVKDNRVCNTVVSSHGSKLISFSEGRHLNSKEIKLISSFPLDYDFLENDAKYICGMSVPPIMMAQIAHEIYKQWITKL